MSVLGFNNGFHGQTTATLSCSSNDANPKNLPVFPWPKAEFPLLRYPLAQNEKYNRSEEERCLTNFKSILASNTVGAVIIEPISGINGQIATPNFYK